MLSVGVFTATLTSSLFLSLSRSFSLIRLHICVHHPHSFLFHSDLFIHPILHFFHVSLFLLHWVSTGLFPTILFCFWLSPCGAELSPVCLVFSSILSVLLRRLVSSSVSCWCVWIFVCGCVSSPLLLLLLLLPRRPPGRLDSPFLRQQHSPSSPSPTPPLRGESPLRTPPHSRRQPAAAAGRYSTELTNSRRRRPMDTSSLVQHPSPDTNALHEHGEIRVAGDETACGLKIMWSVKESERNFTVTLIWQSHSQKTHLIMSFFFLCTWFWRYLSLLRKQHPSRISTRS